MFGEDGNYDMVTHTRDHRIARPLRATLLAPQNPALLHFSRDAHNRSSASVIRTSLRAGLGATVLR